MKSGNLKRMKRLDKFKKKYLSLLVLVFNLTICAALSGCGSGGKDENEKFEKYTREVFSGEVAADTITLHYTLKEPGDYGIEEPEATYGNFETDPDIIRAAAENTRQALEGFSYEELNTENRITYDILSFEFKMAERSADYIMYEEPLGLVSGVQTQIPVVLSEYQFYDRDDIDSYLALLKKTGEYFDDIIVFEREKSAEGLFMSDDAADAVIEQCQAFLDMGDGNYLYSTFADRVMEVEGLSEKEKSDYIQDNALMVKDYIIPAYEALIAAVNELKGTGQNTQGLMYLPEGKEYYELSVKRQTGSDRTVEEMEDLTRRQITDDLETMEQVLGITPGEDLETEEETEKGTGEAAEEALNAAAEAVEAAAVSGESAEMILSYLEEGIQAAFPEPPDTALEVKYVPEEMEEHLSPAFYMIPAIDNAEKNVIYLNQSQMGDDLTLFTTLAHEGYPGHLYQTIYFESLDPDPIRSIFSFGGYVEGWATYAEMGSYYLTPLPKQQATILQKNASVILGLYALADMGIHYEGWSRMDTISFFSSYGITDAAVVERIYDLIIGSPGNYLKYYIGYAEFLELKKDWIEEKQETFSQKEFHEAVLSVGPAPFETVRDYMWKFAEGEQE